MSTRFENAIHKADHFIDSKLPQSPEAIRRRRNRLAIPAAAIALTGLTGLGLASSVEHIDGQTIVRVDTNPKGNIAEVQEAITDMGIDLETVGHVTQAGNLAEQYADRQGETKVTVYENFWGKRAEVSTPTLRDNE